MPKCEYSSISSVPPPPPCETRATSRRRIPGPRKDELPGAAGGDHLIVDQIGREAAQREVAAPLADDLVPAANEMRWVKAFDDDDIAVTHEPRDGVLHRHRF